MNLNLYFRPYTEIILKWTTNLNIKAKLIKNLEENIRKIIHDLGIDKQSLERTQKGTNHNKN